MSDPRQLPIMFCEEMVKAERAGLKTQTRRVMKGIYTTPDFPKNRWMEGVTVDGNEAIFEFQTCVDESEKHRVKAPYQVGDHLYVRETWGVFDRSSDLVEDGQPHPFEVDYAIGYRADGDDSDEIEWKEAPAGYKQLAADDKWRSSRYMPKWAARTWLEVTDVRAERVQDISEEDAIAEGMAQLLGSKFDSLDATYRQIFLRYYDSLNAGRGYGTDSNPWNWAYTVKRIEKDE